MTIKSINYLSLSPEKRKLGAERQRANLRNLLASPLVTEEQRLLIQQRLAEVRAWERGEIDIGIMDGEDVPPDALAKLEALRARNQQGVNHEVVVTEEVPVDDDVS